MSTTALDALSKPHSLHSHTLHCYALVGLTLACLFQDGYDGDYLPSLISTLGMGLAMITPGLIIVIRKNWPQNFLPKRLQFALQFALLWTPASLLLLQNPTGYYLFGAIACGYLGLLSTIAHQCQIVYYTQENRGHESLMMQYISVVGGLFIGLILGRLCLAQDWLRSLCLAVSAIYVIAYSISKQPLSPSSSPLPTDFSDLIAPLKASSFRIQLTTLLWFWLQAGWLGSLSFSYALNLWPFWVAGMLLGTYSCANKRCYPLNESAASWLYLSFGVCVCCLPYTWLFVPEKTALIPLLSHELLVLIMGTITAWLSIPALGQLHYAQQNNQPAIHALIHFSAMAALWTGALLAQSLATTTSIVLLGGLSCLMSVLHKKNASITPIFILVNTLVRGLLKALFTVEVYGKYPEPSDEPTLVIANHSSFLDVPLIGALFPEKLVYPIFPTWMDYWAIREMGAFFADLFPMKPSSPHSMLQVVKKIKTGRRCLIFPEGRLSNTGNVMKLYDGAAFILDHTKARLQTIFIQGGMNHIVSRYDGRSIQRFFPKIRMGIQDSSPIEYEALTSRERKIFIIRKMYQALHDTQIKMTPKMHIHQMVYQAQYQYGANRVVIRDHNWEQVYTYKALIDRARSIQKALNSLPKHAVVALDLPSDCQLATCLFGCFFAAKVALPIDPNWSDEKKISYIQRYKPGVYLTNSVLSEAITKTLATYNTCIEQPEVFGSAPYFWEQPSIDETDDGTPAIIISNDTDKDIVLSHYNIVQHAEQLRIATCTLGQDSVYNQIGIHTALGFHLGLMLPIVTGIPTTLTSKEKKPSADIESIYDTQSSIIIAHHEFLQAAKECIYSYQDTQTIRAIYVEGKLPQELVEHWVTHCKTDIFEVFCPKDTGCIISMHHPTYKQADGIGQYLAGSTYGDQYQYHEGPMAYKITSRKMHGPQLSNLHFDEENQHFTPLTNKGYMFAKPMIHDYLGFITEY